MLYNKEWDRPQRDIHSLDSLISWLETKSRFGFYNYYNPRSCLLAQYFTAMGLSAVGVCKTTYGFGSDIGYVFRHLPAGWNAIAEDSKFPFRTFGGALKRARRLRAYLLGNTSEQEQLLPDHPVGVSAILERTA